MSGYGPNGGPLLIQGLVASLRVILSRTDLALPREIQSELRVQIAAAEDWLSAGGYIR